MRLVVVQSRHGLRGWSHPDSFECGGTVTLRDVEVISDPTSILDKVADLVHNQYSHPDVVVQSGNEISGDWNVSLFNAITFTMSPDYKWYGSDFQSKLSTTEPIDNLRYVWLSSNGDLTGAYPYFSGQEIWLHALEDEGSIKTHRGSPFTYSESANIGFGYNVTDAGVYEQNHWLLVFDQTTDSTTGIETMTYRGGLHYGETVQTTAVPEPISLIPLSLGLLAIRRKRNK